MAEGCRGRRGGILGLCELIDQHPGAVEYDLIRHGLRLRDLGTRRLSWRDLLVIVQHQPAKRSAIAAAESPDDAPWGALDTHLLAEAVDMLHLLVWAKTKDASKGRKRPKPIERPGTRPDRIGSKPLPLDEMKVWLGW